jgi:hypothetical protein
MIKINLEKAKEIAHEHRRKARALEFEPLDEIISKQIPGKSLDEAETERQIIRDKYAKLQAQIDAAQTVDAVKLVLKQFHN